MPTDPAEWLDDYWLRVQYDQDLVEEANLELTINQGDESNA